MEFASIFSIKYITKEFFMETNKTVAFMYDFDETLSKGYMQDYSLIPLLGEQKDEFWTKVTAVGKNENMDGVLAYLYVIMQKANQKNIKIDSQTLMEYGKTIDFFDGVQTWFERINNYGKSLGLEIEHYIISSGMTDIIKGSSIAKYFKKIFACSYCYDKDGKPYWPKQAVNYTNKTQYIYRIRKNQLDDLHNSSGVNDYMDEQKKLPYRHMIYLGDGQTDIPCMKLMKSKGGFSVCVYNPQSARAKSVAEKIYSDGRVNFFAPADYSEQSQLDTMLKSLLNVIANQVFIEKQMNCVVKDEND
jgi:hypothetical protein